MTKAEEEYLKEIDRMRDAISRTESNHLKRDYGKRIARMEKELAEYRAYRYGGATDGKTAERNR